MKMYRVDAKNGRVVETECGRGLAGHSRDSEGNTVCTNTHFESEADAVRKLMSECEAGLHLAADTMEQVRAAVDRAEMRCANAAVAWRAAKILWEEKVL
jgi:hypothetical protein